MSSRNSAAIKDYWGYLIKDDKSPTPLFQELLEGIANYIKRHIAPWEVRTLTPAKLAAFYKLVGGNYDSLFIDSPDASIAFVYKSLGCFYTLEPDKDPFAGPSIPALTREGYVRWQTVQLLLEPELHVPFLQEAVKRFEIKNPIDGETFPRYLPSDALPKRPDVSMCQWEEGVREKLRVEAEPMPTPRGTKHTSRPSDVESLTDSHSSHDDHSIVDAADYFQPSPHRPGSHGTPLSPGGRPHFAHLNVASSPQRTSQSQERRRSAPDRDEPTPTGSRHPIYARPPPPTSNPTQIHAPQFSHSHSHSRGRLPSESTESSATTASRSPSPKPIRPHHHRHTSQSQSPGRYAQVPARPAYDAHGRRHSAHGTYPIRGAEPIHPQQVPPQQVPRSTLSPHFYGPQPPLQPGPGSRPASGNGPSPQPPQGYPVGPVPAPMPQQVPPNGVMPNNNPAVPGAFARGGLRASTGHAYRGDWRQREWVSRQHANGVPPPVAMNGNGEGAVRFADEESPRGRDNRTRRRTLEERDRDRGREEIEFEKARRRDRRGSDARERDRDRKGSGKWL